MDNNKKSKRNVRWSSPKPSNNNDMEEDWTRESDKEAERRDRFIKKENKKNERQLKKALEKETRLWTSQAEKEGRRRDRFLEKLEAKNLTRLNRARSVKRTSGCLSQPKKANGEPDLWTVFTQRQRHHANVLSLKNGRKKYEQMNGEFVNLFLLELYNVH